MLILGIIFDILIGAAAQSTLGGPAMGVDWDWADSTRAALLRAGRPVAERRRSRRFRTPPLLAADVRWITLIPKLRLTGMPIREVKKYADLVRLGEGNERERLALLTRIAKPWSVNWSKAPPTDERSTTRSASTQGNSRNPPNEPVDLECTLSS